ncbi:hypothetical protein ECP030230812_0308 [Escherichia coli P0302308.12]|nr:hypothetical protein ECP030230812_0308 [Escherichia coli P0302308.12]
MYGRIIILLINTVILFLHNKKPAQWRVLEGYQQQIHKAHR